METGPTAVPPLLVSPALPSCWPLAYLLGCRVTHAREAMSWTSLAALWPIGGSRHARTLSNSYPTRILWTTVDLVWGLVRYILLA